MQLPHSFHIPHFPRGGERGCPGTEPARVALGRAGDAVLGSWRIPDLPMAEGNSAPAAQAGSAPPDPNPQVWIILWGVCMDGHFLLQSFGSSCRWCLAHSNSNWGWWLRDEQLLSSIYGQCFFLCFKLLSNSILWKVFHLFTSLDW